MILTVSSQLSHACEIRGQVVHLLVRQCLQSIGMRLKLIRDMDVAVFARRPPCESKSRAPTNRTPLNVRTRDATASNRTSFRDTPENLPSFVRTPSLVDDAVTVFLDPQALDGPDLQHSSAESRFLRLGRSARGRVLMVAYTFRRSGDAEAIRIISARRASRRERAAYAATD
jgi:uncharacterized DUF497 family protein